MTADPGVPVHQIYNIYGTGAEQRRKQNHRQAARAYLQWLFRRYTYPAGYAEAQRAVEQTGTVLLRGTPGGGRQSAAKMLLYGLGNRTGFRELPDRAEEGEPLLEEDQVEAGDRFLLDLTAVGQRTFEDAQQLVLALIPTITDRRAHLVVALPPHELIPDLRGLVVEIGRPDGLIAFVRYLRAEGIEASAGAVESKVREELDLDSMERLATLVDLVKTARRRNPGSGFETWQVQARKAWLERDKKVADSVKAADSTTRATLLAVALLHGSHADVVHHATTEILRLTQHPEPAEPLLARTAFGHRLQEAGAEVADDRSVRFTGLAVEDAALRYFWDNYPELRQQLTDWADQLVRSSSVPPADRTTVAGKLAVQCLRTGRANDVWHLAEHWSMTLTDPAPVAALLRPGLADEHWASRARQQVYDWSGKAKLSDALARLLIPLCLDEIAPHYPEQALVRIHRLARSHRNDAVSQAARTALIALCEADGRLFRRLLARLRHYDANERWHRDFVIFLDVADPRLLVRDDQRTQPFIADRGIARELTELWTDVLDQQKPRNWADYARSWLRAAGPGETGARLTDVLARAASGVDGGSSRLFVLARDWAREERQDRQAAIATYTRLAAQIDRAQNFDPTAEYPTGAMR